MNHRRPAGKRPDKSHHEINRVIRRQDAEVSHAGPKWIKRRERHALLQIIIVRQHAALRPPSRPVRIHKASRVFARSRNESRCPISATVFKSLRPEKLSPGWRFG